MITTVQKYLQSILAAISIAAISISVALGAPMNPEMSDASYLYKTPTGEYTLRITSDGKGKAVRRNDLHRRREDNKPTFCAAH